jgi:hypothetical protein
MELSDLGLAPDKVIGRLKELYYPKKPPLSSMKPMFKLFEGKLLVEHDDPVEEPEGHPTFRRLYLRETRLVFVFFTARCAGCGGQFYGASDWLGIQRGLLELVEAARQTSAHDLRRELQPLLQGKGMGTLSQRARAFARAVDRLLVNWNNPSSVFG